MKSRLDRFWEKVNKSSGVFGEDGKYSTECWIWTGVKSRGYGQFWDGSRVVYAHRWYYQEFTGQAIQDELQCDHLCRKRDCVNPNHIEIVSARTNTLRGKTITARHAHKTHCERGHRYTKENTYHIKTGGRMCRECKRIKEREYYHKVRKWQK